MQHTFSVINFPTATSLEFLTKIRGNLPERAQISTALKQSFIMNTCQRKLIVSMGLWAEDLIRYYQSEVKKENYQLGPTIYREQEAYSFLVEVVAGLQSKLLAESEVAHQFKQSYEEFRKSPFFNPILGQLLEKISKDAKKIKSEHLVGIGQYSYAGLTRRLLETHATGRPVFILGSGQLAHDLGKILRGDYPLIFMARNKEKLEHIQNKFQSPCFQIDEAANQSVWDEQIVRQWAKWQPEAIINTIGTEQILLSPAFFDQILASPSNQMTRLFIDLGDPSVINTPLTKQQGLFRLSDILELGAYFDQIKMTQVTKAKLAAREIAQQRMFGSIQAFPFGWEELQFA